MASGGLLWQILTLIFLENIAGKFSALLVQPEQLSMLSGHLPCLAPLIQQDHLFWKRITRVHVDEAHFIYTTGVELYGLPAFRPAWG